MGVGVAVDAAVVGVTVGSLAEAAVAAATVAVGVTAGCVRVGATEAGDVAVNVGVGGVPGALLGVGVRLSKIIPVVGVAGITLVGVGVFATGCLMSGKEQADKLATMIRQENHKKIEAFLFMISS